MAFKKLETKLYSSWSTYAADMMSVLEDCGMWNIDDTFQEFFGETGIGFQFRMYKNCSAAAVTDYDWEKEHSEFMKRIGVKTEQCIAFPNDSAYDEKQSAAINKIKASIEIGRAVTVWGIDTGEFGIIYGYDDDDGVFFAKGIGSNDFRDSNP
ncbi:MAG: hypothetical protein K0S55_2143, partial [Clostridia bacterium]|nr:hypothetical protein [Clostridia bacterium]